MRLKQDLFSVVNPKLRYAVAGEELKMIAEHGNVWIVEGGSGKRFSVRKEDLTDMDQEVNHEAAPVAAAPIKSNNREPVTKAKAAHIIQKSLF